MMKKLITEITIKANPETVWNILTDFDKYSEWNPFIISLTGKQLVGEEIIAVMQPPDSSAMTFKPNILVFEKNQEFRWKGKLFIKGIFDGEHFFKLTPNEDGSTRFTQGEYFSGIFVPLFTKVLDKTKIGFEMMNQALKEQCEK